MRRDLADLERSLERPPCPECNAGRIRPTDSRDGQHLRFECPIPKCRWVAHATLPEITKKVIYLDTSTVSHMARALESEGASPWKDLYERLRSAVASEAICCPGSAIVEREAEFSKYYSDQILSLVRQLGDPGLSHDLGIQEAQVFRALGRFLADEQASLEVAPPRQDAFEEEVDRWLPVFNLYPNMKTPTEWIDSQRANKARIRNQLEKIFRSYESENASFEAIRESEAQGFGRGILRERVRRHQIALGLETLRENENPLDHVLPTTFDSIFYYLRKMLGLSTQDGVAKASEFLLSEHVKLIPSVDIRSKLYAALAMLCRGNAARLPRASDSDDIDHLATHLPYVDVLIADRFFADLCNQNHLKLGELYQCDVRALGPADVPKMVAEIDRIVEDSPQSTLAERIQNVIHEGGYHQEFADRAAAYLRDRGIDAPS